MSFLSKMFKRSPEVKADPLSKNRVGATLLSSFPESLPFEIENLSKEVYDNVVLFRCIDQIASSAASCDLRCLGNSAAQALLDRPNPFWNARNLIYYTMGSYALFGNAYLYVIRGVGGRVLEMWPISPQNMSIRKSNSGLSVVEYEWSFNGVDRKFPVNPNTGQSDILHFQRPNLDVYSSHGASAGHASRAAVAIYNQFMIKTNDLLTKALNSSGVLSTDQEIGESDLLEIRDTLRSYRTGNSKSGDVLVLSGATWNFAKLSEDPDKIMPVSAKQASAREIAMAFSIPPMLLGLPGDNSYANLAEARRSFWLDVLIPMYLEPLVRDISAFLFPGGEAKVEARYDDIPAVREARLAQFQTAERASFLTINEKRALLGYSPLSSEQGGDLVPLVERLKVEASKIAAMSEDVPLGDTESGDASELSQEERDQGTALAQPNGTASGQQ